MNVLQNIKYGVSRFPQAITDNATVDSNALDTKGADEAAIIVVIGATDIAISVVKLQESADDSTWTDVTGGAHTTLPSATDDNKLWGFFVRCSGERLRYLRARITVGDGAAGAYVAVHTLLARNQDGPYNATTRGLAAELIV